MAYERPGVYVKESAFITNINANSGVTAAAFLGTAERGPVTPTAVTSWNQYRQLFGELTNDYDLGYAVYHYFANGGQTAYVTRVADSTAVTATSTLQGTPEVGAAANLWTLVSKSPGGWGNSLTVDYTFDETTLQTPTTTPKFTNNSLFAVTVKLDGTEVENWSGLSIDPSNSRYLGSVLDLYSSYIKTASVATVSSSAALTIAGLGANDYVTTGNFANGSEGSGAVDSTEWASALDSYDVVTQTLLFNLVGQTSSTIVNDGLAKMQERGNSFLIIDTSKTATSKSALESVVSTYAQSSYGAVYGPALKMFDPTKTGAASIRTTFPGGAVAGAFVRSEIARGVSKAPAGYSLDIRNVYGLVATLTETEQGSLYKNQQLNLFTIVPGVGVVINGARTLARNTADKFITVRRSLNFLKQTLKDSTAYALFEPNDVRLWEGLTIRVSALLTAFWGTGGLKGNTTSEAFYVVCNSTNNTPTTVEDGQVNIEVGVALQNPAEFIVITVSQWAGGSTATTNI
jgi:phage tail sheath protein FI